MRWRRVLVGAALLGLAACDALPGRPRPEDRPVAPARVHSFEALYAAHCAGCHGAQGVLGPAQPLADPLYLALVDDETLRRVTEQGVPGSLMPGFARSAGGPLDDAQVEVVLRGMRRSWGRPGVFTGGPLPPYDRARARARGGAPGGAVAGRRAYARHCAGCHGPDGSGGPHGGSIVDPDFLALVSDQGLRTTVITGRTDLGMPDWRGAEGDPALTDQEISDLVAWLATRRPARAAAQPAQEGR